MTAADEETIRKIMGEIILDELKVIHEYLAIIPVIQQDIAVMKQDISELITDSTMHRTAIIAVGNQANDHEQRIVRLERRRTVRGRYT